MAIANILGVFSFLFFYWRKLKDDYSSEKIFNAGIFFLLILFSGQIVARLILPDYHFWITLIFIVISQIFAGSRMKLRFFENLDALIVAFLSFLIIYYLFFSIIYFNLSAFILFWLSSVCLFLFFFFDSFYRSINWYRSGKVGFSGLATAGIFFLTRAVLSFWIKDAITFSPKYENVFSATFFIVSSLLLLLLSRKYD